MFALVAIGCTLLLSIAKSSSSAASNGPSGFAFPSGVQVDSYSTSFVNNFFQTALSGCEQSADTVIQQKGLVLNAAISTKVNRACGCAADYMTANLNNDDVHAKAVTAHEHEVANDAIAHCRP
jgi:hypothetical protein